MIDAKEMIQEEVSELDLVFVSVDPERDTSEVLAEHLELFEAGVVGLTGPVEDIQSAAKAYRVGFHELPDNEYTEEGEYFLDAHTKRLSHVRQRRLPLAVSLRHPLRQDGPKSCWSIWRREPDQNRRVLFVTDNARPIWEDASTANVSQRCRSRDMSTYTTVLPCFPKASDRTAFRGLTAALVANTMVWAFAIGYFVG